MLLKSTKDITLSSSLKEGLTRGACSLGGLYLPQEILPLPKEFFDSIEFWSFTDIASYIFKHFFNTAIADEVLEDIVKNAFNFPVPIEPLTSKISSLELFHGPTYAFKDFGARAMSGLLDAVRSPADPPVTILAATSGDTGGAVASSFFAKEGFRVVVLYPHGRVSKIQEKQFTTLGKNIFCLEVNGAFDDCQRLVNQAFRDEELNKKIPLSSANSINIGRLLPQCSYYFWAYAKANFARGEKLNVAVPSGNFGNLTAGLIAKKLGLPLGKLIAGTNLNDTIPRYLKNGVFSPKSSLATISNAMDVGNPNNFPRLELLSDNSLANLKKDVTAYSFTDRETEEAIRELYLNHNYITCPHSAIGYLALNRYLRENNGVGCFLSTAHPAKFPETVTKAIGKNFSAPNDLAERLDYPPLQVKEINADFHFLKDFLLEL
jgi:threonine synthase